MALFTEEGAGTFHVPVPCTIFSLTVSDDGAGAGDAAIHRYRDTGGRTFLHVQTITGTTAQVTFRGAVFPDGFSVVAGANNLLTVIEYEPLYPASKQE